MMEAALAREALDAARCLRLRYNDHDRVVEVHTLGVTTAGHLAMTVWQVEGGSRSGQPVGWKRLALEAVLAARLDARASAAPRPGYRRGDKGYRRILAQV